MISHPFDHDFVVPRIAVGSAPYARADVGYMRSMGITHVLSCESSDTAGLYEGTGIAYLHCPTDDDGAPKGEEWFMRGVRFGVYSLMELGTKLLVHCAAGVNRSPGMAYAILRARGLPAKKAAEAVLVHRRVAQPRYFADADRFIAESWR